MERRVIAMDSELRKALKEIKRLNKQMADLYSDTKEMSKSQDEDVNWLEEMKESLGRPSKTKHQPPVNTIESMVAAAWK